MHNSSDSTSPICQLLPSFIRRKVENREGLIRILNNVGWLLADRILRMAIGLIVGIWIARYLGPKQFGLMNYVIAFVALFSAISGMGLKSIVVRDLVIDPANTNVTIGTAFILQLFGGLLSLVLAVTTISLIRQDHLARIMVAILGTALVFKASEVVKYWFAAQVASKYTVWVETVVFLVVSTSKVVLILLNAPLIAFVWAMLAEAVLMAIGLLRIYTYKGGMLRAWRPRINRTKTLLKDSWPLILSSITVVVYMRIDQIMLGQMIGDKAVGIYSAAVRVSEMCYFVPVIIVSSISPALIKAKKDNQHSYHNLLRKLYRAMLATCLTISIPITFFSTDLIRLLYGTEYKAAGIVLAIHIWACIFVALGVVSSQPLLLENLQRLSLYRTITGCILNIFLNFLFIPLVGITGAAIATNISYFVATFSLFLFADGRPIASLMFKSIFSFPIRNKL